jgi:hypothetical protein
MIVSGTIDPKLRRVQPCVVIRTPELSADKAVARNTKKLIAP